MRPLAFIFHRRSLFVLAVVVMAAIIVIFTTEPATRAQKKGLRAKTVSQDEALPNYDIRTDKAAQEKLEMFRTRVGRTAADVADLRDGFVAGERSLREKKPRLKVEYNDDLRTPEVITPDVTLGRMELARPVGRGRVDTLKNFLDSNDELVGVRSEQISRLRVAADYTNPDGKLSFVELEQEINGIPVFRGELKAGFDRNGNLFRVVNNLAPDIEPSSVSTDFGDASSAVNAAYRDLGLTNGVRTTRKMGAVDLNASKVAFGKGDFATTAEKMYFPTEPGVVVPAWRVLIWQPVNAYYVVVDAATGTTLWRKNITEDQTQSATYNVYANPNAAFTNVADSPFPYTPGPTSPNGTQGAAISRSLLTLIGNEGGNSFNSLGWINDGGNETDGNNVEAGLDRDTVEGVDATNGRVAGSPFRVFNFPLNPFNPNTNTGDSPTPPGEPVSSLPGDMTPGVCHEIAQPHAMIDAQRAAVVQLFYITNRFHDAVYALGFNEAAKNFQNDNFGQGGLGNDRVSAEAQDCSGTNNANFATPADGTRGRMQMYIFTAPNPDIDGDLDADVIIHEATHGLSNRLHGNSTGLTLDIARGMGEGWSDFFAHCLLSEPADPINAIYSIGAYDTYTGVASNNSYYGIRRFPKAVKAFTGGPMNRPHNPLTFQDIDSTKMNINDGAFAPDFVGTADQVHNIGEVWSSALWEVRANFIQHSDWLTGNTKAMQYAIDGMKLAPLNPTPISERDAMIAAVIASGTPQDVADTWAGFAVRGFGDNASVQRVGGVSTGGFGSVRVTESFDTPNLQQDPVITVSDATGNNNGFIDPGEPLQLTIPLTNLTGINATTTSLQIAGGNSANYGSINHGTTSSQVIPYVVPGGTACGSLLTLTLNVTSSLGPTTIIRSFPVGAPINTLTENFDTTTPPAIPAGWTMTSSGATNFVTTSTAPDTFPNSAFAGDPTAVGGSAELASPVIPLTAAASTVSFRHRYNTENGWDGAVLEISVNAGSFQDITEAGGTFLQNGYNGYMGQSTGNPIGGRAAWTGDSGAYITTIARMPASAVGQNIQLRWRFAADNNTAPPGGGWNVDTIQFAGAFTCSNFTTASGVEVSGRVLTPQGRGLRSAVVSLIDASGETRTTVTGARGNYRFTDIEPGRTYVLQVSSRMYEFDPVVLSVNDTLTGVNFIARRPRSRERR